MVREWVPFKAVAGQVGNKRLTHKFFKILFALTMDEMGDLTTYILNKKATLSVAIKNVPKITIKNLLVRLKG